MLHESVDGRGRVRKYFEENGLHIFQVKVDDVFLRSGMAFGELGQIENRVAVEDDEFGIFDGIFFPKLSVVLGQIFSHGKLKIL